MSAEPRRELRTVWRIRGVPGWPGRLSVELAVDTEARAVVAAIERAARGHGIELERLRRRG